MKKSTYVPLIIFLLLAGSLYYLLSSFHIDMFTGSYTKFDLLYERDTVIQVANVSLADVSAGKADLDGKSLMIALGIVAGFPLLVALLVRGRIKRKERKRLAAIHSNAPTNQTVV